MKFLLLKLASCTQTHLMQIDIVFIYYAIVSKLKPPVTGFYDSVWDKVIVKPTACIHSTGVAITQMIQREDD